MCFGLYLKNMVSTMILRLLKKSKCSTKFSQWLDHLGPENTSPCLPFHAIHYIHFFFFTIDLVLYLGTLAVWCRCRFLPYGLGLSFVYKLLEGRNSVLSLLCNSQGLVLCSALLSTQQKL